MIRRRRNWLIVLLAGLALFVVWQKEVDWQFGSFRIRRDLRPRFGLDLRGGTHLVLQAEMKDIPEESRDKALKAAKEVISRRVNLFGVSEPVIQTAKVGQDYRIIVELPGIEKISQAIDLIGRTAQLDFREASVATPSAIGDFRRTGLTGRDLKEAQVRFNQQTGQPEVALEFNQEGRGKFSQITQRNVGRPVAIFLDELPLTIPRVQEPITDGQAVISGDFTTQQAKNLAIQLNAGALPTPIKVVAQKNIGPTLGKASIQKSIFAGGVGLFLVVLFMALYYGKLGLVADVALVLWGLTTFAIYKLIPVVLTLPGIAGFFLSLGMAVDSNILIFERIKEELRGGQPKAIAMNLGFGRAWEAIKDANFATLLVCFILFNPLEWSFLATSGMIRGFALTLALGVMTSLFTGVIVTKALLKAVRIR